MPLFVDFFNSQAPLFYFRELKCLTGRNVVFFGIVVTKILLGEKSIG